MKRVVALFLYIILVLINIPVYAQTNPANTAKYFYDGQWHVYTIPPTFLQINGENVTTDMPPIIFNDRSVVPARAVFEKLGAKVTWDGVKSQVGISMNDTNILLSINDKNALVNGKSYEMDIPPKIINSRTMIPTRFVAETLGMEVDWVANQRLITINYKPSKEDEKDITNIIAKNPNNIDIKINKIEHTVKNSSLIIKISADAVISEYSAFELDANQSQDNHPKLVLDIKNAILDFETRSIEVNNNNVLRIRSAQFAINPNITRVVIDLNNWTSYNVEESKDKKEIYITFQKEISNITGIKYKRISNVDAVDIHMDFIQKPDVVRLTSPDRVFIDIPSAELEIAERVITARGKIVKSIRYAQKDNNTVRVVVDVKGQPQSEIEETDDGLRLKFINPSYKNIYYSNKDNPQLTIYSNKGLINYVEKIDVDSNSYTITVPASELDLGEGRLDINDGYIDYIDIVKNTKSKTTDIILKSQKTCTYSVQAKTNSGEIVINAVPTSNNLNELLDIEIDPRAKKKIVVVDPGHGGKDPGAIYYNEIQEKDPNLDISLRLYKMLKDSGIQVYITRKDDTFVELADRAEFANKLNASLFISVHNNAMGDPNYDGTMTLYYPSSSSYTFGYGITGRRLAQIAQEEMVKRLGTTDRGLRERPRLAVLRRTKMPAIIAEVAFITNYSDRQKLKTDDFRQKAAEALYIATIRALNESVSN